MNLADLIRAFRSTADDRHPSPYLWPDCEVIDFAAEAESEACRRAELLRDSTTPEICSVMISPGASIYSLDSRILRVVRAKLGGQSYPLSIMTAEQIDATVYDWESLAAGVPLVAIIGGQDGGFRLHPPALAPATLTLTVIRLPLKPLKNLDDTPEIPERYHRKLVDWMLYRGYSKHDSETRNPASAQEHLALFEREFGQASARNDLFRQRILLADPLGGFFA